MTSNPEHDDFGFTYLLVFVRKAEEVVRKIASQVHCKGDVAT